MGYDASGWENAQNTKISYNNLRAQIGEPVKKMKRLSVKEVLFTAKGEQILDFGQTICGRVEFRLNGKKGQKIQLDHTEVLDKDGNYMNNIFSNGGVGKGCDQKIIYTAKDGAQSYEPLFTFMGFRYVKVQGIDRVKPEDFCAVVLSSEKENLGDFSCSDDRINRLYQNTRWSQCANMLSIPTDCPQREKAGWTGDVQIYTRTSMLNEDLTAFYTRWLENMTEDQDEYGIVPMVVPCNGGYIKLGKLFALMYHTKGKGTSAGWGDAAVITPYRMYEVTGNKLILIKQYNTMKKWCDYVIREANQKTNKKFERKPEVEKWLWDTGFHYGEWLIPSYSKEGFKMSNMKKETEGSSFYTAPIFGYISISYFAKIAGILGKRSDEKKYQEIAEKMKHAIMESMFDENGNLLSNMMGAYVLFLYFELVPEKYIQKTADGLIKSIENNKGCLDTGFLATPYLLDALCKIGRKDVAYQVLMQEKCPSWLYEVLHGATTIWESWFAYNEDGTPNEVSMNHYSFGCVDDWIFKQIGGISETEAGFKKFRIAPDYDCGLSWAKRSYLCEHGLIECQWNCGEKTELIVKIPCNTTADVTLPDGTSKMLGSGTYRF